jgi:hypothetical protein
MIAKADFAGALVHALPYLRLEIFCMRLHFAAPLYECLTLK